MGLIKVKILITGGAGYIGSTLIERLLAGKDVIFSIDNLSSSDYSSLSRFRENPRLKLDVGDVCDLEEFNVKVNSYGSLDAIVHLAAVVGVAPSRKNPEDAISTNIHGTYNVLETARKKDIGRLILASTAAVYGNPVKSPIDEDHPLRPLNLYGVTKLAAEGLFNSFNENYGLHTTVLRFSNLYGVGLFTYWRSLIPRFVMMAYDEKPLTIYGDGRQSRDFIHVRDVAKAIAMVLSANRSAISGETFNVGAGEATSIRQIAGLISVLFQNNLDREVELRHLGPREGETYAEEFVFSNSKIKNRLGFGLEWSIEEGINELINYYSQLKKAN